ncbi:transposase [Peptostreptococcus anaerobius]|nr:MULTISPECIES: transposase [Peptostreptococcus]MDB8826538.1 transposase [Peptostreptococcus anaerobius]MDB8832073.1 transposase [Peptostreptococcus anaerobius]MDB8835754.1 transposase [Peptostreptococcus anaerobius]MDB8837546.1 transposase [Peptostreptococcus anaerobius]MDB8839375.1 transposase [Peptostreptococcus anaerobius]
MVEYVTTDVYRPYIDLAKKVFPNANIVVDKFHIVHVMCYNICYTIE